MKYLTEHHNFLLEQGPKMTRIQLTDAFNSKFGLNISYSAMKSYCFIHKIESVNPHTCKRYSFEQIEFIRRLYPTHSVSEITTLFNKKFKENRSKGTISQQIFLHDINKFIDCERIVIMGKKLSKFDFDAFEDDSFAVSAQRYTREEAEAVFKREYDLYKAPVSYEISEGFVRHRAGYSEEQGNVVTWWLETEEYSRSCPVYVFRFSTPVKE